MKGTKGSAGLKIGNTSAMEVKATKPTGSSKKPDVAKGGDLRTGKK